MPNFVTGHNLIFLPIIPLVPSSAPSNVAAVANDATSINVTWDEVPLLNQNGVITGYIVFYKEATATEYTSLATMHRSIQIKGLQAATQYALRVLAYNNKGNGIASQMIVLSTAEMGNHASFSYSYASK